MIDKKDLLSQLNSIFEADLVAEMSEFPVLDLQGELKLGEVGEKIENISIVLRGSIRAVRDEGLKEIKVYNVNPMQSCILTLTSAMQEKDSKVYGITNEESSVLIIPKQKGKEWMEKYESWRKYNIQLYEIRLEELVDQHHTIFNQKERITESIRYASRIQNAVLPPQEMIQSVFPENFVLYKPRDIVSGDYYWMTKADDKVIVAVADCTGHGVPGAFMSILGVALLNQVISNNEFLHANEILEQLRKHIKASLRQTGESGQPKDGMDMVIMIFDFENNVMEYSGAHNPLYIFRSNELIKLKGDLMPVGVSINDDEKFTNHVHEIKQGDAFYAFSDGYTDQIGGEYRRKFMRRKFIRLLEEIHQKPMAEQKTILDNTIEQWKGNREQIDDILVMGIRI